MHEYLLIWTESYPDIAGYKEPLSKGYKSRNDDEAKRTAAETMLRKGRSAYHSFVHGTPVDILPNIKFNRVARIVRDKLVDLTDMPLIFAEKTALMNLS